MTDYDSIHYSVMKKESIDALEIKPDGIYVDCTCGAGGHSEAIAERLNPDGLLISIDEDISALEIARKRLSRFNNVRLINDNFSNIENILDSCGIGQIDGAVIDLGVSSMQLRDGERGFAYMIDGPLDMRMNSSGGISAADIVNTYSESELCQILREYGEEKFSSGIARKIVAQREIKPITTTGELSALIESVTPKNRKGGHPAKRTFQALRIEVNHELEIIQPTLECLIGRLKKDGVLAVISFHSLEDRIVKKTLASKAGKCTCPPEFPICVCGAKAEIKVIKDLSPSGQELSENPPSHSARLRCAKKL